MFAERYDASLVTGLDTLPTLVLRYVTRLTYKRVVFCVIYSRIAHRNKGFRGANILQLGPETEFV